MPSDSLQHLLKLLQKVSDQQESYRSQKLVEPQKLPKKNTYQTRSSHSLGDGISFLEKFKARLAEPIARSTPNNSPIKSERLATSSMPERRQVRSVLALTWGDRPRPTCKEHFHPISPGPQFYERLKNKGQSFSMPDLLKLSPIQERRGEGNTTGPGTDPKKKIKFELK